MSNGNFKSRAQGLIVDSEGFVPYMYLDSVSQVTVGYGYMIPTAIATGPVNMANRKGMPASTAEKVAEWNALRKLSPTGAARNYSAASYQAASTLRMTEAEGLRLLEQKMDGFVAMLRSSYPAFDTFPDDARVALLDMAYNLGAKIHTVFVSFTKAVNKPGGPDWIEAAKQSHRPQLSAARNEKVKQLFLSAARGSLKDQFAWLSAGTPVWTIVPIQKAAKTIRITNPEKMFHLQLPVGTFGRIHSLDRDRFVVWLLEAAGANTIIAEVPRGMMGQLLAPHAHSIFPHFSK